MPRDDIYKIETNDKIKIDKKLIIILAIILVLIVLILSMNNIIKIIKSGQVYREYEEQLISLQKEEEKKKIAEEVEKERIRQSKIPKLTELGRTNIDTIYKSDTKRAFLTFDDGPSSVTSQILDILKQENVKATFFVLGAKVKEKPEIVKRMYDEGHYIANHGYSHSYSTIYASPQSVLDEFNQCNEAVKEAIGVPEYNSHLFRFPGGLVGGKYADIKSQAKQLLNENDILNIDWNALTGDAETSKPTQEFEMQRLSQTVGDKNSVVILMHDAPAKKVTADTLQQIIAYLRERGYEFKNFYEIIK